MDFREWAGPQDKIAMLDRDGGVRIETCDELWRKMIVCGADKGILKL